jgi:hypothetical protein
MMKMNPNLKFQQCFLAMEEPSLNILIDFYDARQKIAQWKGV